MYGRFKYTGVAVYGLTGLAAALILVAVLVIIANIVIGGWNTISWEFITASPTEGMTKGGVFPAIVGTFLLVIIMSLAGVPVGTITAIYLSEYAISTSILARMIRFAVNTLAGVPAIVFGLFGLGFFVQFVGKGLDHLLTGGVELHWSQPNILWASLTMSLLTLPVVIVSVEEAIRTVPGELREASLALGATKWQTIRKVVIPHSLTGILTGGILAVSRGAGEVAPILFTGAAYFLPHLPSSLSDQFMELGYHVYIMATQSPDVEATRGIQYATTLVLLLLTFGLNFSAIYLRHRLRRMRA
ncbi:MAG: phosphate ABC transporter permease PstA [Ignavibacteriae bacterium]|nr:phosphate ABC transporter permease PstA [Ignavibacteria bacterium]MBI3363826.1 phosphate ABC transporter permease PstA [Ignavibacteriota bacterium]